MLYKLHKQWYEVVRREILAQVPVGTIQTFRSYLGEPVQYKLTITAKLNRLYDLDNLYCKAVIDALKGYLITDDSPKYLIELNRKQERTKDKPEVIVELEVIV